MHDLGITRSSHCRDHLVHTPDTFVRAPLPGMQNATAIVHIGPAGGAAFTQYTAEFEPGGRLGPAACQRFVYALEGELDVAGSLLHAGDYAWCPVGFAGCVSARGRARAAVIEKRYQALAGVVPPDPCTGREGRVQPKPFQGDNSIEVRTLLPDNPGFDCAVNTMTFQPGASLPLVEIHIMEHGLLMLSGGGIYRLGDRWYPVKEGDFIWMAPHCPQWFGALGKIPAKYLIYKDWNRHPLAQAQ